MKKIITLIISAVISVSAYAGDWETSIGGFSSIEYGSDSIYTARPGPYTDDFGMTLRPVIKLSNGAWTIASEVNLSQAGIDDANWLRTFFLEFNPSENLCFRAGRIVTSSIFLTLPASTLETVRYHRVPIGIYAYGGQVYYTWDKFSLRWDVTTDIDTSFQKDAFRGPETSGRLSYNLNDNVSISVNVAHDIEDAETFFASDIGYQKDSLKLQLIGYKSKQDQMGGVIFAGYRINESLEVHADLDYQEDNGFNQTVGGRFFFNEKTDLTADYIHAEEEDILAMRIRYRF